MPYIKSADWCRIQQQLRKPESEDFSDLKLAIAEDAQNYSANDIANTLLNDVCVKLNCREEAFVMEKGESVRVQPFRLTDGTYKVVSRSMLTRILEETPNRCDCVASGIPRLRGHRERFRKSLCPAWHQFSWQGMQLVRNTCLQYRYCSERGRC